MEFYIIYKYTNQINNKSYIGQTKKSLKERAGNNGSKYQRCTLFHRAIKKYGWDNFIPTILEKNLKKDKVDEREQYWIKYYKTDNPNFGYNLTSGGWASHEYSEEARKRMSIAQKNKSPISEITREKMRNRDYSYLKGKNHYLYGKHISEETKKKISKKLSNGNNPASRKVQCIETGEIFDTVSLASQWCNNGSNSLRSHIAKQIRGERKSCGKHPITNEKLHWRYIDENK